RCPRGCLASVAARVAPWRSSSWSTWWLRPWSHLKRAFRKFARRQSDSISTALGELRLLGRVMAQYGGRWPQKKAKKRDVTSLVRGNTTHYGECISRGQRSARKGHMQCSKDRSSFNRCVSTHQKRFRDRKANGLGSSKIDGQLELRGLLYGQIVRLPAL